MKFFGKNAKHPRDMADGEIQSRYEALAQKRNQIDRRIPWVAGAIALAGAVVACTLALAVGASLVPLLSVAFAAAGTSMSFMAMARDNCSDKMMELSIEASARTAAAQGAQLRAAEKARQEEATLRAQFRASLRAVAKDPALTRDITGLRRLKVRVPDAGCIS